MKIVYRPFDCEVGIIEEDERFGSPILSSNKWDMIDQWPLYPRKMSVRYKYNEMR